MSASQNLKVTWMNVPTRTITAGGVLDNWDPRVVDGFAAQHHVITFLT